MAEGVGRAEHLRHPQRRPAPEILCARDVPLSVGAHPYGARAQLHHGRRGRALQTRQGVQRAPSHGLGRVRAAGRERRHGAQGPSQGMDLPEHRGDEGAAEVDGAVARLGARDRDLRSVLLQAPAEDVRRLPARGSGRAQARQGELGPGRSHRARQRAGDRRSRLALGRIGRAAGDAAVVLPHHQIFRGSAAVARRPGSLAREGARHAAQLDRPFGGVAPALRARSRDHPVGGRRGRRLHHAPRHAVRREVLGALARSSARHRRSGQESCARRIHRGMQTPRHRAATDRHRREARFRHRDEGDPSVRSRVDASGLRRQLRPDGLRHRRDLRLPGARPARPRFRQQIRARQHAGRVPAWARPEHLRHHRYRLRRRRPHDQLAFSRRHDHRGGEGGGCAPARTGHPRQSSRRHPPGQFSAARLGHFAPALLGLPDPGDPLRDAAASCRCRRAICR